MKRSPNKRQSPGLKEFAVTVHVISEHRYFIKANSPKDAALKLRNWSQRARVEDMESMGRIFDLDGKELARPHATSQTFDVATAGTVVWDKIGKEWVFNAEWPDGCAAASNDLLGGLFEE